VELVREAETVDDVAEQAELVFLINMIAQNVKGREIVAVAVVRVKNSLEPL
jgi:hypothetical protein